MTIPWHLRKRVRGICPFCHPSPSLTSDSYFHQLSLGAQKMSGSRGDQYPESRVSTVGDPGQGKGEDEDTRRHVASSPSQDHSHVSAWLVDAEGFWTLLWSEAGYFLSRPPAHFPALIRSCRSEPHEEKNLKQPSDAFLSWCMGFRKPLRAFPDQAGVSLES